MPKRTNEFQRLVTLINGCVRNAGKVTESAFLVDRTSDAQREVDILISSEIADYPVNISVEVRDRARKADVAWVEEMYAKHSHLPTDKLVLVSRRGFSKAARGKARFYGIEAITFEEALATDWDLATRMTSSGVFIITTLSYRCSAVCDHRGAKRVFAPAKKSTTVFLPYREAPTDFDQMAQFFLSEPRIKNILHDRLDSTSERVFTMDYTPQSGTYVLDADGTKMTLLKFAIEIEVEQKDTPINFLAGRYGNREVVIGHSMEPGTQLYYALVRKENGRVEGLLSDEAGLRRLIPDS